MLWLPHPCVSTSIRFNVPDAGWLHRRRGGGWTAYVSVGSFSPQLVQFDSDALTVSPQVGQWPISLPRGMLCSCEAPIR